MSKKKDKIEHIKIPIDVPTEQYKLVRQRDNLSKIGTQISWVEWDEDGHFLAFHDEPKVGFSCLLGPRNTFYIWMTTVITELISDTEFKTENSHYKIEKVTE